MSDANRTQVAIRPETVFSEAVGTALTAAQIQRFTKFGLNQTNGVVLSDQIRADRQRADQLLVTYDNKGSMDAEVSYGTLDPLLEAHLCGTWTANVLQNGLPALVNRSFLMEEGFLDLPQYITHQGVTVDTFSITIEAGKIILANFGLMGTQSPIAGTSCFSAPVVVGTSVVMTAASNFASLQVAGSALAAKVMKLTITGKNNLRVRRYVGALASDNFGRGFLEISGTMDVYFTDAVAYALFFANTAFALSFNIGGVSTQKYAFALGVCKMASSTVQIAGVNSDVMQSIAFNGFFNPATGAIISITRTP